MLEVRYEVGNDIVEIWRDGKDDYTVFFYNAECSVRGTLLDVMKEITDVFKLEDLKEVKL